MSGHISPSRGEVDWCDSLTFDLVLIGFWAYFTLISFLNVNDDQGVSFCVIVAYLALTAWWAPILIRKLIELLTERDV